jgi:hypothetical protein
VEHETVTRRPFLLQFKDRQLVPAFDALRGGERITGDRESRR